MRQITEYVKQASNFHFPCVVNEYLSTKVAKPSIIKATNKTIKQIVKDELDRLGHDADLNHIDVSEVTNMDNLFSCDYDGLGPKYEDLNQDISRWDVSQIVDARSMFKGCKNFNQDLSQWDVNNIENIAGMFEDCENFDQDISGWNVSNVRNMSFMFEGCKNFNQDLSGWDVSNVKYMVEMFDGCENFNQDISGWDVSNVKLMKDIFKDCFIEEEFKPKFNI